MSHMQQHMLFFWTLHAYLICLSGELCLNDIKVDHMVIGTTLLLR